MAFVRSYPMTRLTRSFGVRNLSVCTIDTSYDSLFATYLYPANPGATPNLQHWQFSITNSPRPSAQPPRNRLMILLSQLHARHPRFRFPGLRAWLLFDAGRLQSPVQLLSTNCRSISTGLCTPSFLLNVSWRRGTSASSLAPSHLLYAPSSPKLPICLQSYDICILRSICHNQVSQSLCALYDPDTLQIPTPRPTSMTARRWLRVTGWRPSFCPRRTLFRSRCS
jgi:hypothetical protein